MWRTAGQQWFIKGHEDLSDDSSWHIIWHFTFCKSFCCFIYWSDLFVLVSHLRRRALVSCLKIGFHLNQLILCSRQHRDSSTSKMMLVDPAHKFTISMRYNKSLEVCLGAFILRDSPATKMLLPGSSRIWGWGSLEMMGTLSFFSLAVYCWVPGIGIRWLGFARTSPTCWTSANSHWQTMWTESIYSDQWGVHRHPMKLYINPYWFQEYGSLRLIALVAHLSLPLGIWPWDLRDILSHEKFQGSLLEAKKSGEPHIYHNKLSAAMDFSKWKEWEILGIALHSALPLDQDFQRGRFSSCSRKLGQ